jgi:uncharacterized protein (UPF0332 family)
MGSSG